MAREVVLDVVEAVRGIHMYLLGVLRKFDCGVRETNRTCSAVQAPHRHGGYELHSLSNSRKAVL